MYSCKEKPYEFPFKNSGGYVIGKERCNDDTTLDYWLIDLSIFPRPGIYGDTLLLNGIKYNNVVKTKGLHSSLKIIGQKVDFDFHLSDSPVQPINCNLPNPITFSLKDMQVLNQAEIR